MQRRRATTLIEVILVVVILGVMSAIVLARIPTQVKRSSLTDQVMRAKSKAIRSRRAVTIWANVNDTIRPVTAMWDGSVLSAKPLKFERMTGAPGAPLFDTIQSSFQIRDGR